MSETHKPRILFIVQLPPPLHGASMMNSHIVGSRVIKEHFDTETVNLHFAEHIKDLGKFTIGKLVNTFGYGWEIFRKALKFKPDLVYFNLTPKGFAFYRDAFYTIILKLLGREIVFHLQSKGVSENVSAGSAKKFLYRMVFRNTSIICLSPKLTDDFDRVFNGKIYFVPNGIEQQDNTAPSEKENSVPVILYLSHLLKTKGILVLTEALKILKDNGHDFRARLVGPPADLSIGDVQKDIDEKGLTGIAELTGPKYGEEKYAEFREADIFTFPTYYEVFGLVLLEAMQFGLPVVASIEGAIPDIVIDTETGFLVEKQNPAALAERLGQLISDNDLRHRLGSNGLRRFRENYTIDRFESNVADTIHTILKSK